MKIAFDQPIILENDRVKIEPLTWDHVEQLLPIALSNPDLLQYSPPRFGTEATLRDYFENNLALRTQQLKYPLAIFDKRQQEYAGSTSYMNINEVDQRLEIGSTWIGKSFQRTGLNRNGKFLLMQYAFETLLCERLEFKTDARNLQSRTAIEGVGGIYEGTLRSHTVMSDGFRRDTVYYSVLAAEWPDIKEKLCEKLTSSSG